MNKIQNAHVSDAPWLGRLPNGWKIHRLKWTVKSEKNGVWGDDCDGGTEDIVCIRVADFNRDVMNVSMDALTMRSVAENQRRGRLLARGNLLLEKSGGGEKQPVGAVVVYDHDVPAVCSNFVAKIEVSTECSPRFIAYLHAHLYSGRVNVRSIKQTTGIQNLDAQSYFDELIALPSKSIQCAIANFLDLKTAAIDVLIAKKERLLALLSEKRAVFVHQAVTKGLEPDVPTKDSGVPWIGEIPAHWMCKRIKFTCKLESGHTPSRAEPEYWVPEECVIPWVSLSDTKALATNDYISVTAYNISPAGMRNSSAHLIAGGAVVFTRDATIGLAAITTGPMAVSQHIIAWSCGAEMTQEYLLHVIRSMTDELNRLTFGATLKTIGMADVRNLVSPVPPLVEQARIAQSIKARLTNQDQTTAALHRQVAKLKEFRQALITSAVTGQLDISEETTP